MIIAELHDKVKILMESCARVEINHFGNIGSCDNEWMQNCKMQAKVIESYLKKNDKNDNEISISN